MNSVKYFKTLLVLIALVASSGKLYSQECANLIPVKPGATMEMKHYNATNQLQSTSVSTVKSKTPTPNGYSVTVDVKSTSEQGKKEMDNTLTFKCENGSFVWDMSEFMKSMLPEGSQEEITGMKDMELKYESTPMKFPAKPIVGQKLEDARATVLFQKNGLNIFSLTTKFVNRKVEAMEKITTPAGTYSCFKISYDIESKSMVAVQMRQVDWMAEGIGIVRTEHYDKDKKLQGYSVLTSFKE
ncbi:MAG: hypothetical protein AB9842_11845 [Bacteroidales bacterium]